MSWMRLQVDVFGHDGDKRVEPLERIEQVLEREAARGKILQVTGDD